jgi:hypothetical protein
VLTKNLKSSSDFDIASVGTVQDVAYAALKFDQKKVKTFDNKLINSAMQEDLINAKAVRNAKESGKKKHVPFFNTASQEQVHNSLFASPLHTINSQVSTVLNSSPSAELFRELLQRAKGFKHHIDIEKTADEIAEDKKNEADLINAENSAREARKEFVKNQMREYNQVVNSRRQNYQERRKSVTKHHQVEGVDFKLPPIKKVVPDEIKYMLSLKTKAQISQMENGAGEKEEDVRKSTEMRPQSN